jgi:hypothetical protein
VGVGEGGEGDPGEVDVVRLGGFGGGRGEVWAFDGKDEGDFRDFLPVHHIGLLKQSEEVADLAGDLEFFDPFASEGLGRGLAPFDVSAGQVVVAMPNAPADQQLPFLDADSADDNFDFLLLWHDGLLDCWRHPPFCSCVRQAESRGGGKWNEWNEWDGWDG